MIPEGDPSTFTRTMYGCEAYEVHEIVVLTPFERVISALKARAKGIEELDGFYKGFNGSLEGVYVTVLNSMVDSPLASDCTYFLRFTPCKKIIYTGLIGALQPEISVGDLIAPTAAVRGEGASKYFVDESYPAVADFDLLEALSSTLEEVYAGCDVRKYFGSIYTTDSFAAETKEFLERLKNRNLLGIDMETSAIYVMASLYGMKAVAVHVVSDNPVNEKSFFHIFTEEDKGRKKECEGLVVDALVKLATRI